MKTSNTTCHTTYETPTAGHTPNGPIGAARAQIAMDVQLDPTQGPVGDYMPLQVLHIERRDYESLNNASPEVTGQEGSVENEHSLSGEYENVPEIQPRSEFPLNQREHANIN